MTVLRIDESGKLDLSVSLGVVQIVRHVNLNDFKPSEKLNLLNALEKPQKIDDYLLHLYVHTQAGKLSIARAYVNAAGRDGLDLVAMYKRPVRPVLKKEVIDKPKPKEDAPGVDYYK